MDHDGTFAFPDAFFGESGKFSQGAAENFLMDLGGLADDRAGDLAAQLFIGRGAFWLTLCLTSLIAALIVGLKAVGKHIAMDNSEKIVLAVARVLTGFRK